MLVVKVIANIVVEAVVLLIVEAHAKEHVATVVQDGQAKYMNSENI